MIGKGGSGFIGTKEVLELMKDRDEGFSVSFFLADGRFVELDDCIRIANAERFPVQKYVTVVPKNTSSHPYPVMILLLKKFNGLNVFQG